jgi:hypothetical protein
MSFLTEVAVARVVSAGPKRRPTQPQSYRGAGHGDGGFRTASAPVRRASDAARERALAMLGLHHNKITGVNSSSGSGNGSSSNSGSNNDWEDQRPIQSLAELPEAIRVRTKRMEDERTRAYIASQKKAALLTRPMSTSLRKLKVRAMSAGSGGGEGGGAGADGDAPEPGFPSNSAASVLAEFELAQRSYTRKLTSPKQVGFMRALHKIEKKHNVTSFTQSIDEFKPQTSADRQQRNNANRGAIQWRTLKL